MIKKIHGLVCLLLVIFTAEVSFAGGTDFSIHENPQKDEKTLQITLLHTNDHHGRFWKNVRGEYGMAARKTLIDRIRSEVESQGGYVLLLDAGDINTGMPESKISNAEPDIKGMNLLGYDAMVVGNHEFDKPLSILRSQQSWMKFPLLSANIYDKITQKPLFDPFAKFNFKGLNIIVLGLITEDTITQGHPDNIQNIGFINAIDYCRERVPQLKKDSDILIALTHLGYYPDGVHGSRAPGSVCLARAVNGIDVIVDGHTHKTIDPPDVQNNTIIIQAGEYGKYLGRLDLEYSDGKLTQKAYQLIPVNLKKKIKKNNKTVRVFVEAEIPEDPQVLNFLSKYQDMGRDKLNKVIGSSDGKFIGDRDIIRNFETNLGNLLCRAVISKTSADLSIMNSGGVRAGLPSGPITFKDVLKVSPFGNTVCTVLLTGRELIPYLEKAVNMEKDTGGFAQISGATIFVSQKKITRVLLSGKIVSGSKKYKLVLPSYIASGGDGYPNVSTHPEFIDTGFVDADILKEYILKHSPLKIQDFQPEHDVIIH
jgi:5'-nucleotidase / UDP-sugar diphosphatase